MHTIKEVDSTEWNMHFKNCHQTNMLQHWQYAAAKESTDNLEAVRFLVSDEMGNPVALAQFLTKTFSFIGGVARMNRGPILIGDYLNSENTKVVSEVMSALKAEAKKRRWWLMQVAPEMQNSETAFQSLNSIGFRKLPIEPWASGLLSLVPKEDELLAGLHGKWRNCLRKGLRLGVAVKISNEGSGDVDLLIKQYQKLQKEKGFSGIPDSLVYGLAGQNCEGWKFNLFYATEDSESDIEKAMGILVTIRHGDTSTYFIGATNDVGRKFQVNYVLLWKAILNAKDEGCKWFDIGGLNNTTPKGVAHFKNGLNAEMYSLVGEWRIFCFPW